MRVLAFPHPMTPLTASLAILLAASFQQSTPTPATATFHSEPLHLDYTYGGSFTSMPAVADDALKTESGKATGAVKVAISCISLPLVATDPTNGLRMIMIMRVDGTCLGNPPTAADLGTLVTSSLTKSLERFGDPQMGTSTSYEVAGHPAAALSGTVKSSQYGATFYGTASCLIQGKDAVCWEFLASDCSRLPDLIANPIKFDGQPAQPLIPAKFAQSCKP